VVIASSTAPASNIKELILAAKSTPEKISFASNGNGTAHHLAGELFMQSTKTKMTVVQYKSTQAAMQDMVGERIQYGFLDLTAALPLLSSGRVKGLATTGPSRSSAAPNIPTVSESGLPGYEVVGWFGLFAPKGTPPSIIATLNEEVRTILADPDVRSRAAQLAIEVKASTPAELLKYQISEIDRWAGLINTANIKLD
jgi:tripartite-type tricarboxylate transporter receptor subunit TctC